MRRVDTKAGPPCRRPQGHGGCPCPRPARPRCPASGHSGHCWGADTLLCKPTPHLDRGRCSDDKGNAVQSSTMWGPSSGLDRERQRPSRVWRPSCHRKRWQGHREAPWSRHSTKNQQNVHTSGRFHPWVVPPAPKTHPYTPAHLGVGATAEKSVQASTRGGWREQGGHTDKWPWCDICANRHVCHLPALNTRQPECLQVWYKSVAAPGPPRWAPSAHLLRHRPGWGAGPGQHRKPHIPSTRPEAQTVSLVWTMAGLLSPRTSPQRAPASISQTQRGRQTGPRHPQGSREAGETTSWDQLG